MVFAALLLFTFGFTLAYTGFKPPNGNPYDVWYWWREAFKSAPKKAV